MSGARQKSGRVPGLSCREEVNGLLNENIQCPGLLKHKSSDCSSLAIVIYIYLLLMDTEQVTAPPHVCPDSQ